MAIQSFTNSAYQARLNDALDDLTALLCIAAVEVLFGVFVWWIQWDADRAITDRCRGCMQACAGECVIERGGAVVCKGGLK